MKKNNRTVSRDEIVSFCCRYLNTGKFQDYCVNGLQVEGSRTVSRAVSGVSVSEELIKAAVIRRAELVIVHHGIFGSALPNPPVIRGFWRKRLALLLANDITLCGFHLPLDAHPKIGNNASLCRLLGIGNIKPFEVGYVGTLPKAESLKSFAARVDRSVGTKSMVIEGGPKKVRHVAVISGGSSGHFQQAMDAGADTFLCGDMREENVRAIEELGLNVVNGWHYNTEKLGVQNLGKLISTKFRIPVEFVDVPCGV